jgi:hypothetical protein
LCLRGRLVVIVISNWLNVGWSSKMWRWRWSTHRLALFLRFLEVDRLSLNSISILCENFSLARRNLPYFLRFLIFTNVLLEVLELSWLSGCRRLLRFCKITLRLLCHFKVRIFNEGLLLFVGFYFFIDFVAITILH